MDFAEKFLDGLVSKEIDSLYRHYEKYICGVSANNFINFTTWVNYYEDSPYILRSMCNE